jgi:uncharacterized protein (DUF58 family)
MLNIFRRKSKSSALPLFDEAFLRRMERLSFRTVPALRGGMVGERRSQNLRPALDFSDHRPYAVGDDLRHVDWHAYARHNDLFVKLGEATQRINLHILLDASGSMGWQAGKAFEKEGSVHLTSKWDVARRLTGALGYLGLAGGERLKITPFAETLGSGFGPTQGKRQVTAALKYLSDLTPFVAGKVQAKHLAAGSLANSLERYARTNPRGGLLLIISDLLDTAVFEESGGEADTFYLAEGLRHLPPPRWQVLVLHLLTTAEVQPTLAGDYDLEDIETTENLPFRLDEATLAQYRLRVRRWGEDLQAACARRGAAYSRNLAEWPLEQKVVPYLRQRGLLQ